MPIITVRNENGILEMVDTDYREPTAEELKEQKRLSGRCGHIKRRLKRDEALTGEMLELAVSTISGINDKFHTDIVDKLTAGTPLNDYEKHMMLDVYLLHVRLSNH